MSESGSSVARKYFLLHIVVFCFRIFGILFVLRFFYVKLSLQSTYFTTAIYAVPIIALISVLLKLKPLLRSMQNPWDGTELSALQKICFGSLTEFASLWNGYEIHGIEKVDRNNTLLVGYHSRSNLDLMYLLASIQCHLLLSHLLFYVPMMRNLLPLVGAVPARGGVKDKAETSFVAQLAHGDRPLMLLPGGAFECLKDFEDIGQVHWKAEPGFARVIVGEQALLGSRTKVVPFYTRRCEDCLWTTTWWYTYSGRSVKESVQQLKDGNTLVVPYMMVTLLCSLGFFLVPKPVKMDTYFGPAVTLNDGETAVAFAARVAAEMQKLIDTTDALPERPFPNGKPSWLFLSVVGTYTAVQSAVVHSVCVTLLLFVIYPAIVIYQQVRSMLDSKKTV